LPGVDINSSGSSNTATEMGSLDAFESTKAEIKNIDCIGVIEM
jgi:hypothetical protein